MNPFGLFDAFIGTLDLIGLRVRRKHRKQSKAERISFMVVYVLLMLLGLGVVFLVIWKQYFQHA